MSKIKRIIGREILDSRGNPTVEAEVEVESGFKAYDSVPSGASTGKFEALELRDDDSKRYNGKGVLKAVENINGPISEELIGRDSVDQKKIDWLLKELDGTDNKTRLGANAILAVSLAVARVSAKEKGEPLFRYLESSYSLSIKDRNNLPVPMFNIINGGAHADNSLSIQEFMLVPVIKGQFEDKVRLGAEIYHQLKKLLKDANQPTGVGDEGGFAVDISNPKEVLELIMEAGKKADYIPQNDFAIGLDVAASEFSSREGDDFIYKMEGFDSLDSKGLSNYLLELTSNFPIISIEDPLDQEDWKGWQYIASKSVNKLQIVGDDLFVTNKDRLKKGIDKGVANSILIKLNQIGTLTETIETIKLAKQNNYSTIISHRSGETEDVFIADLAVATNSQYIKSGSLARSERVATYNQLLRIEDTING